MNKFFLYYILFLFRNKTKGNVQFEKIGRFGLKNIQKYSNVTLPDFNKNVITTKSALYSFEIDCSDITIPANSFVSINSGCCLIVPLNTVALCYIENTNDDEYSLISTVDSADIGQLHVSLYTKGTTLHKYKVFIYLFKVNSKQLSINNPNGNTSNKKLHMQESNIINLIGSFDNLTNFKKKSPSKIEKTTNVQPTGTFINKCKNEITISKAPFLISNRKRCIFSKSMIFSGGLTNKITIEPHIINYNSNEKKNYLIIAPLSNIRTKLIVDENLPIPPRIVMGLNGYYSNYPFYKSTILTIRQINDLDSKYNINIENYKQIANKEDWVDNHEVYEYGLNIIKTFGSSMTLIIQWQKYKDFVKIVNDFKTKKIITSNEEIMKQLDFKNEYKIERDRNLSFILNKGDIISMVKDYDEDMLNAKSMVEYDIDLNRFAAAKNANKLLKELRINALKNNKNKENISTESDEPPSKKSKM